MTLSSVFRPCYGVLFRCFGDIYILNYLELWEGNQKEHLPSPKKEKEKEKEIGTPEGKLA